MKLNANLNDFNNIIEYDKKIKDSYCPELRRNAGDI